MAIDPVRRFQRWFFEAARRHAPIPEAAALATATRRGAPAVRFVLLKQVDHQGFVFFTDARSRKGRELAENARAALAFYWDATGREVRVEGRVEPVSAAEADAYWAKRPREKRLAASASHQSAPLARRSDMLARWRRLEREYRGKPIPRPPAWTGYRIVPEAVEFWTRRPHRLHERELFLRGRRGWRRTLLQP